MVPRMRQLRHSEDVPRNDGGAWDCTHQFTIVSGIGQAAKFPHYTKCNTFNGLHGRSLPVANRPEIANHEMLVMAVAGDGDCYGEGGNHSSMRCAAM